MEPTASLQESQEKLGAPIRMQEKNRSIMGGQDFGLHTQLQQLDGFDRGAISDPQVASERGSISEGVTFCDIELDAERGPLKLTEDCRRVRLPTVAADPNDAYTDDMCLLPSPQGAMIPHPPRLVGRMPA